MNPRTLTRHLATGLAAACLLAGAREAHGYGAIQNKADNTEIRIVPTPGKVAVNGDLKDWDLSGAIFMFLDEGTRDSYHMRAAMMYDQDALYIGGVWKDPTPMMNQYTFGGEVNMAWNADALQVFLVANPAIRSSASTMTGSQMPAEEQAFVNYLTLWHSTQDQKAGFFSFRTLGFKEPTLNPAGVEGVFAKDTDGKGSTFEYRIPWGVLRAPGPMKAGDAIQMLMQIHWGNEQGTDLKTGLNDVRNPKSRALGYMGPDAWGLGRFMEKGNLPAADAKAATERAISHIPVKFTLEKDGKVSISIRDAAGRTVCTGIGAEPYPAGENTWLWDGLDDRDQPLPAGSYTAMILTHDGIGQKYVCDVGVSGTPPYQTEDGTGGWAGDYNAPTFVAVDGDRVVLGTGNAEAQKPAIGTDLEGKKLYGTAANGDVLALHKGFGYFGRNGNLTRFNTANGRLEPFADGRPNAQAPVGLGLAVLDDTTLVTANGTNTLFLVDIATGKQKSEVATSDPSGMFVPYAVAVDTNNRLWVCESDGEPKRYSVWNADGSLDKEFFGSLPYSTSGYFDPKDPEKFYAFNVRYLVDYDKGAWRTDATILRDRTEEGVLLSTSGYHVGGRIVVHQGRKFLLSGTWASAAVTLYEEVDNRWLPRLSYQHKGKIFWLDANQDGAVQKDEIQPDSARLLWGGYSDSITIDNNLNLYAWTGQGYAEPTSDLGRRTYAFAIHRLDFLGFAKNGALQYADAIKPIVQVPAGQGGSPGGGVIADDDGSTYLMISGGVVARGERVQSTGARVAKYGPDGKELWCYANIQFAFAWTSSSYTPGFLVSAFRLPQGYHPALLPVTGYYGQYFLLDKQTGLFVDAIGQDQRSGYTLDHTMVLTENFNGNIFKHPKTGKTYFAGGDADCRIWELTGLDSIKRSTVKLGVTDAMVVQSAKNADQNRLVQAAALARLTGRNAATLQRLAGATADGKDGEWQGVAVLPIGEAKERSAQVQVGFDDQNLYARFEVKSAVPFLNTPTDPKLLFKSGSALELCLTPHLAERKVGPNNRHPMEVGDLRVLISRTKDGKLIATRYRPKIGDKEKPLAVFFETPAAGREDFDEIAEWNDLPMHYREIKGGYVVEVALPWSATAVRPQSGLKFLFDAGVITGNEGGTRNAVRAMWSDRTPELGVNNDIPTESRMHPNGWGVAQVE